MPSMTANAGSAGRWGPLWGARPDDWAASEEQQAPTYEEAIRRVGIAAGQPKTGGQAARAELSEIGPGARPVQRAGRGEKKGSHDSEPN